MAKRIQYLKTIIAEEGKRDGYFSKIEVLQESDNLANDLKSKNQLLL
ncbi:hypothetical protein LX73_1567 [Fodinibius salinus]|uniref:Uncharacterized protein n=1 Tax=Fodinibius salinus TaxID=860790 RepID=A0A5D3YJ42_9BACT|nr:hypothetical protein [Fodinibius salinus]TYP93854.1 hypothetical protein LX73_1567 [Fodinibius salinus]